MISKDEVNLISDVLFMILLDNNIKFEEVQINEYLTPLNSIRINSRVGNLEVIENLKYCIGSYKNSDKIELTIVYNNHYISEGMVFNLLSQFYKKIPNFEWNKCGVNKKASVSPRVKSISVDISRMHRKIKKFESFT